MEMRAWEVQVFIWESGYGDRKYDFKMFQPSKPTYKDIQRLVQRLEYPDGRMSLGYVRPVPLDHVKVNELDARELLDLLRPTNSR